MSDDDTAIRIRQQQDDNRRMQILADDRRRRDQEQFERTIRQQQEARERDRVLAQAAAETRRIHDSMADKVRADRAAVDRADANARSERIAIQQYEDQQRIRRAEESRRAMELENIRRAEERAQLERVTAERMELERVQVRRTDELRSIERVEGARRTVERDAIRIDEVRRSQRPEEVRRVGGDPRIEAQRLEHLQHDRRVDDVRLDAQRFERIQLGRRIDEARIETQRFERAREARRLDDARLETRRLDKLREERRIDEARLENQRLEKLRDTKRIDDARLEKLREERRIDETRLETQRIERARNDRRIEETRLEARRTERVRDERRIDETRLETQRIERARDERRLDEARLEARRVERARDERRIDEARLEARRSERLREERRLDEVRLDTRRIERLREERRLDEVRLDTRRIERAREERRIDEARLEARRSGQLRETRRLEEAALEIQRIERARGDRRTGVAGIDAVHVDARPTPELQADASTERESPRERVRARRDKPVDWVHEGSGRLERARDRARHEAISAEMCALSEIEARPVRDARERVAREASVQAVALDQRRVRKLGEETVTAAVRAAAAGFIEVPPSPLAVAEAAVSVWSASLARDLVLAQARELGSIPPAKSPEQVALEAARRAETAIRGAGLRREYEALAGVVAPYRELRRRTRAFNRGIEEIYGVSRKSREHAALRLDAEHFIDQRFFAPFEQEFRALGIDSPAAMPAFAVHYAYHLRTPRSLAAEAGLPGDRPGFVGTSLTQEKLLAIPHNKHYPTLVSLLEAFAGFWRSKAEVEVKGEPRGLAWSYSTRLEPELAKLIDEARKRGL